MSLINQLLAGCNDVLKKGSKKHVPLTLLGQPVPASRPRVTRWGTYYGKNYTRWRKAADDLLKEAKGLHDEPIAIITVNKRLKKNDICNSIHL